jgi:hypothetical protein
VDENLGVSDYSAMSRPDLVGITAFTSQANRAYEVAAYFRGLGVAVVMGGIHATLCLDEVMERCDRGFYSRPRILRRVWSNLWQRRKPWLSLVGNLSYGRNLQLNRTDHRGFRKIQS